MDVCHTLYKSNTTYDFLEWYLSANQDYQRLVKFRQNLLVRVAARAIGHDIVRSKAIAYLKGLEYSALIDAATIFVDQLDPIPETMQVLKQYRSRNYQIVLLSSSLDFIVEAISRKLNAKRFHASQLDYQEGICQGVFASDLATGKRDIIERFYSDDTCDFITDNFSDLTCAPFVDQMIAVYEVNDSASAAFWKRNKIAQSITYE